MLILSLPLVELIVEQPGTVRSENTDDEPELRDVSGIRHGVLRSRGRDVGPGGHLRFRVTNGSRVQAIAAAVEVAAIVYAVIVWAWNRRPGGMAQWIKDHCFPPRVSLESGIRTGRKVARSGRAGEIHCARISQFCCWS